MNTIEIKIEARKDENYDSSYKPCVWVNGKFHWHPGRNKKSKRGAMSVARKEANGLSNRYGKRNHIVIVEIV